MSTQIRASHILLMYSGSERSLASRTRAEAQAQMSTIADELNAGGDFTLLAKRHSDCPSAARGGDLGTFARGAMVAEFDQVAFDLEVGATSSVIETPFGYHLIWRTA